jgi:hypothetical protein
LVCAVWFAALGVWTIARAQAPGPDFHVLEDRLSDALDRYDAATVGAMWDDRFVFVFPNGRLAHKAERLAGMKPPAGDAEVLTSHNDSVDVQYQDKTIAVVTVRSTWRRNGIAVGDGFMATHVWIRRGAAWLLLSAQVARMTPQPGG